MATGPPRDRNDEATRRQPEESVEDGVAGAGGVEHRFDMAMLSVYSEAALLGYRSARTLEMVRERGGVAIAREILSAERVHDGLAELFLFGRLDLTVEYQVLLPEFEALFSDDERRTAQRRLGLVQRTFWKPWADR